MREMEELFNVWKLLYLKTWLMLPPSTVIAPRVKAENARLPDSNFFDIVITTYLPAIELIDWLRAGDHFIFRAPTSRLATSN